MRIEIVDDWRERMKEDDKYVRDALAGKVNWDPRKAEKTIIFTPKTFGQVFSPERIRLLIAVKQNRIDNIYRLAKKLERPYEAVHRDIKYLASFGFIKIKKQKNRRIPVLNGEIRLPVFGEA